jgi:hypothetical protein
LRFMIMSDGDKDRDGQRPFPEGSQDRRPTAWALSARTIFERMVDEDEALLELRGPRPRRPLREEGHLQRVCCDTNNCLSIE